MIGVKGPSDSRFGDPVGDLLQVIVIEAEATAYGVGRDQVKHFAGRSPATGQLKHLGEYAEQVVGLPRRPVGEHHPQRVPRVELAINVIITAA